MSPLYSYVKNQALLGNFDEVDLGTLVTRKVITESEKEQLVPLIPVKA